MVAPARRRGGARASALGRAAGLDMPISARRDRGDRVHAGSHHRRALRAGRRLAGEGGSVPGTAGRHASRARRAGQPPAVPGHVVERQAGGDEGRFDALPALGRWRAGERAAGPAQALTPSGGAEIDRRPRPAGRSAEAVAVAAATMRNLRGPRGPSSGREDGAGPRVRRRSEAGGTGCAAVPKADAPRPGAPITKARQGLSPRAVRAGACRPGRARRGRRRTVRGARRWSGSGGTRRRG